MAALVQSFPQQTTTTVTMIQTRPASAGGMLQNTSQAQTHHQYSSGMSQMHRNNYHGINGGSPTTYRGQTSMGPVAPYAFTSTPGLSANGGRNMSGSPYLRHDQRTASAPSISTVQAPEPTIRSRYPAAASISTASTSSSSASDLSRGPNPTSTKEDFVVGSTAWVAQRASRPISTVITSTTTSTITQNQLSVNSPTTTKPSPDRYRRPAQRRADSGPPSPQQQSVSGSAIKSGSTSANVASLYNQTTPGVVSTGYQQGGHFTQIPSMQQPGVFNPSPALRAAVDDMHLNRQQSREDASRYRRRSIHTTDLHEFSEAQMKAFSQHARSQHVARASSAGGPQDHTHPLRISPVSSRPASSPGRTASSENSSPSRSNQSRPSSATKREQSMLTATANPAPSSTTVVDVPTLKHDQPQLVNIPPRGSSDATKRIGNPSPLSKPMTMSPESPVSKDSFASTVSAALQTPVKATYAQVAGGARPGSPAARQLAALTEKGDKKSKASRLRRAFSFGSAAELRRASGDNSTANNAATDTATAERTRLRKERYQDEREAEQARIAQKQEEGGIGQGIYSGQGNFFSGSTDNLSISSTASSASIMIRKMGQGMKKSTRSLVGLFRPKSTIGVPAAESAVPQPSQAQVTMVTVEAERERTNINVNLHDQAGGGTGFPHLERNSIDAANAAAGLEPSPILENGGRKSIIGGEEERAKVLAAVKKGILKRSGIDSGNSSPVVRPSDNKTPNFQLPPIPHVNDSPISSAPSTPNDESQGHKRTGSVTLGGEDYFMSALKFRGDTKSAPGTPQGTLKRNATFSPRIQFHDTWPSGEYDRRGEIATCNRLTPMLAQQIKEELNSFKMEMEVHENSKIYTHFF